MAKITLVCFLVALAFGSSFGYLYRSENFEENQKAMLKYAESFVPEFVQEYQTYFETGNKSAKLSEMMSYIQFPKMLRKFEIDDVPEQYGAITCLGCKAGVNIILDYRRRGKNEEFINKVAIDLCKGLNIQPDEVCEGVVPINIEPIIFVIDARPKLDGDAICSLILQGSCGEMPADLEFHVEIDPNFEEVTKSKDEAVPRSDNEMKILHFTDIHFQPNYLVGGNANCEEPLCCRSVKGLAQKEEDKAGYWGDYRDCDTPIHTVINALDQMAEHAKDVDLIYYTGDIIDHTVWGTSQDSNYRDMEVIHNLFKEKFPNSMIIAIPGNHESHPVNVFAPTSIKRPSININWLYQYLADVYSTWLPDETRDTILRGAYYTLLVKPGFRIIALNNNDCYTYNWWVLYGQESMREQLQWFHDTLLAAEAAGEKVHVVIHIPSGEGSCNAIWSREYTKIIERFHQTISGQFTGHTHKDEMNLYYDRTHKVHATSVSFNAGSLTPFSDVNPNYAIYYVDNELFQVNEFESWIFNLTEANQNPDKSPRWFKQYSFKEDFGLKDLTPASIDQLVYSMARDKNRLNQFWTYKVKGGDPYLAKGCDKDCQKTTLCEIVVTDFADRRKCNELVSILNTVS